MGGYIIYFAGIAAGVGVIGFWFFFYYALLLFYIYKRNNNSLPRKWVISAAIITIVFCLSALIAAVCIDSFNDFIGFSVSYLVVNLLLFLYSFGMIEKDLLEKKE